MGSEAIILFGVPIITFAGVLYLAYWLGKIRNTMCLTTLGLVWVAFTAAMFFGLDQASGWDGLAYLAGLIGISAPAGVGYLLGGPIGWFKSEKAMHA